MVPALVPCNTSDTSQLWWLPNALTVSGLVNVALNLSLAAGNSTIRGTVHGSDPQPLLDSACDCDWGCTGAAECHHTAVLRVPPTPPRRRVRARQPDLRALRPAAALRQPLLR